MKPLTPLKAGIIAAGFVSSPFLLDLNCALEDPSPRYPRSRMFKWPISVDRHDDRLTVCHPVLAFEPFVQRVVATLKTAVEIQQETPGGLNTPWHHCVDIGDDKGYRDLIATAHLVPAAAVLRAVVINTMNKRLTTANARVLLAETLPDAVEPDDRSAHALSARGGFLLPAFIKNENGKGKGSWAINLHSRRDRVGEAWAAIHGLEDGWFKHDKSGYAQMTPEGLARHMGVMTP